ncbi:MAG: IS200/IS605 family transposase [Waterburya sp.]
MTEFKSNNNVVFCCKYHVIWVTKYRRSVLDEPIEKRLKELLLQIAQEIKVEILEMEVGDCNHVHLLISLDPQFGVHRAVKRFKGATSRYLREEFPHLKQRIPTLWTNSYFVSTCGGAPLAKIKEYIQSQKRSR